MTSFYQGTALHSSVSETSLNQHWWFIFLQTLCGVTYQQFLSASTLIWAAQKTHWKRTQRYDAIDLRVCISIYSNIQRSHLHLIKKTLCNGACPMVRWPKLGCKNQYSLNIIVCLLGSNALINIFSLFNGDWKICTFTYLCKSSCLQMPWIHHSKDICILLGCLYTGLHHRC